MHWCAPAVTAAAQEHSHVVWCGIDPPCFIYVVPCGVGGQWRWPSWKVFGEQERATCMACHPTVCDVLKGPSAKLGPSHQPSGQVGVLLRPLGVFVGAGDDQRMTRTYIDLW